MKYFHQCKNKDCDIKTFWGRKNKLFHDEACKASYHNSKAAEFRKELLDTNVMQNGHIILKVFYKISLGKEPVDFEDLLFAGFDPSAPIRIHRTSVNGFDYRVIHGYGYRFTDETKKQVIINSKDELKSL